MPMRKRPGVLWKWRVGREWSGGPWESFDSGRLLVFSFQFSGKKGRGGARRAWGFAGPGFPSSVRGKEKARSGVSPPEYPKRAVLEALTQNLIWLTSPRKSGTNGINPSSRPRAASHRNGQQRWEHTRAFRNAKIFMVTELKLFFGGSGGRKSEP
jgi:hypothetical protein